MAFRLMIETENAAFGYEETGWRYRGEELARILRKIARSVEEGDEGGKAVDSNGNTVGAWTIEEDS